MPKRTWPLGHIGQLVGLALAVGLLAAAEIWRGLIQATTTAERSVVGLVRLLAEQTERTIQAIDLSLIGISDALRLAPALRPNDPAFRAALQERLKRLTAREREVMSLVVTGRMNKQIAADLDLSEITVKVHRGNVMHKMGARSLAELVRMADQLGVSAASKS